MKEKKKEAKFTQQLKRKQTGFEQNHKSRLSFFENQERNVLASQLITRYAANHVMTVASNRRPMTGRQRCRLLRRWCKCSFVSHREKSHFC